MNATKKVFLFCITLFCFGVAKAQTPDDLRSQGMQLFYEGKFTQALATFERIIDKPTLENTTVTIWKEHIKRIIDDSNIQKQYPEEKKRIVTYQTKNMITQGVYSFEVKKFIIPPVYHSIEKLQNWKNSEYYNINHQGETALLDSLGNVIIPFKIQEIKLMLNYILSEVFSDNGNTWTVYDDKGSVLYDKLSKAEIYNHYLVSKNKQNHTIIDLKNQQILADQISSYQVFYVDNQTLILFQKNGKYSVFDVVSSKWILENEFDSIKRTHEISSVINNKLTADNGNREKNDEDFLIIKKNSKFGIYNLSKQNYFVKPIYDSITPYGNALKNKQWTNILYQEPIVIDRDKLNKQGVITMKNGKYGAKDCKGQIILEPIYDEVIKRDYKIFLFRKGKKWGASCFNNITALRGAQYDFIICNYGYTGGVSIDVYKNKQKQKYSSNGKLLEINDKVIATKKEKKYIDDSFIYLSSFNEQITEDRKVYIKNNLYGIDDEKGNEIVKPIYTYIDRITKNLYKASKDSIHTGIFDKEGNTIIPLQYKKINPIISDLFEVVNQEGLTAIYNDAGNELFSFADINISPYSRLILQTKRKENVLFLSISERKKEGKISYYANGEPIYEYENYIVKYENGTIKKVLKNSTNISYLDDNPLNGILVHDNGNYVGFYNYNTSQYTPMKFKNFHYVKEYAKIVAKEGGFYSVVLDTLLRETEIPFKAKDFKNGFFYIENENGVELADIHFKKLGFTYPKIEPFIVLDKYSYVHPDLKNEYSKLFKFFTSKESRQYGIINAEGKIIVEPNSYDQITVDKEVGNISLQKLNHCKEYIGKILIASNSKENDIKKRTLYLSKGEKIGTIFTKDNWGFSNNDITNNHQLLIRTKDSIKIYNIDKKKYDLKSIGNTSFKEDFEGGFSEVIHNPSDYRLNTLKKFSSKGNFISESLLSEVTQYNSSVAKKRMFISKKNGKYGVIDVDENTILPFHYDTLVSKNNHIFIAKRDTKYGVIDTLNQTLIEFKYNKMIWARQNAQSIQYFIVAQNKKFGVIDLHNNTIIPFLYASIKLEGDDYNSFFIAKKESDYTIYRDNKALFKMQCDSLYYDKNSGRIRFMRNQREGYCWMDGNEHYDEEISMQKNKLSDNFYLKLVGNQKYIQNKEGKNCIGFPVNAANAIHWKDDEYDNAISLFVVENTQGKFGLFDNKFSQILPFEYEEINVNQNIDLFIVRKNELFGVVNAKNQIVIPIKYQSIYFEENYNYFECEDNKRDEFLISPQNVLFYIEKRDN